MNYIVPQLACSTDYKLFGGAVGWNTIVPFSEQNSGNGLSTNGGRVSATFWWGLAHIRARHKGWTAGLCAVL